MKRILVCFIAFLVITNMVFAEEAILVNFDELVDDYQGDHQATLIDYSVVAGTRFTDEEKEMMKMSLFIPNWKIELSSSSQTVLNNQMSYVRAVTVADNATRFSGEQVMGVRVHFPEAPFNSYAWIKPPFQIPAYATNDFIDNPIKGSQFDGYGVKKNVGVLKNVRMNVYGMNYPFGLAVVLRDENENTQEIPLGYLDFDGWRELSWANPNYIVDVRNRTLKKQPLYPRTSPLVILDSIQVYRDAMQEGGDFIGYIKDVTITYDQAIVEDLDSDLRHEEIWGILNKREELRRQHETARLSNIEILRYLEEKKMHKEDEDNQETVQ